MWRCVCVWVCVCVCVCVCVRERERELHTIAATRMAQRGQTRRTRKKWWRQKRTLQTFWPGWTYAVTQPQSKAHLPLSLMNNTHRHRQGHRHRHRHRHTQNNNNNLKPCWINNDAAWKLTAYSEEAHGDLTSRSKCNTDKSTPADTANNNTWAKETSNQYTNITTTNEYPMQTHKRFRRQPSRIQRKNP